jgi:hypothetical protein
MNLNTQEDKSINSNISSETYDRIKNTNSMNETEKKEQLVALDVLQEKGEKDFIKHVFTNPKTNKPLTYGEMRAKYG